MWLFFIILGLIMSIGGYFGYKKGWFRGWGTPPATIKKTGIILGSLLILLGVLLTSIVVVKTKHTLHLTKKYGSELKGDRVIAVNGERGRQGRLLQEGFIFSPFIRIINDLEQVPYVKIEEGQVGLLTAVDGRPLGKDLFIAPDWVTPDMENKRDSIERSMLDVKSFLNNNGYKGPQLNVLKPGEHKINTYMFDVEIVEATRVPDGHVGVIISRVGLVPTDIQIEASGNQLATPVVDRGFMGVWKETLKPGMYYLNRHPDVNKGAYEVKLIDTRIQTWAYKGGYDWYSVDLSIGEDGKISQVVSKPIFKEIPSESADGAIRAISKDSWEIYVDGRILVQVQPEDAPYIIASVGGLDELENKITTPLIRSVIRNIAEKREAPTFVWERSKIENEIDTRLKEGSTGTRLTIKEFKMNEVYIKPELLVPDRRKQLANKMESTYKQEQRAYAEKIKTEKSREEAEQQGTLVKAKIEKMAAAEYKEAEYLKGQGTKLRMIEEAKGQAAQRDILGVENTFKIEMMRNMKDLPAQAWNTPLYYNTGGENGENNDPYGMINVNQMLLGMDKLGKLGLDVPINNRGWNIPMVVALDNDTISKSDTITKPIVEDESPWSVEEDE